MLCGENHPLVVHGYPTRRYRNRDTGENTRIPVVSILCPTARAEGRPYTKRILPDFLIPHCVIRLDHALEAIGLGDHERTLERACDIMGCIDPRTAGKHLHRVHRAAATAALELAELRAMSPELGSVPGTSPDAPALARLLALYRQEAEAVRRSGEHPFSISLRQILQTALWKFSVNKPSTCASALSHPP